MVQRTVVSLVDDLDNSELNGDGKTVTFGLENEHYELDLSTQNLAKLQEALAPYMAVARRIEKTQLSGRPSSSRADSEQFRGMREWAREHGFQISQRGRIAKNVQDAYHAAAQ